LSGESIFRRIAKLAVSVALVSAVGTFAASPARALTLNPCRGGTCISFSDSEKAALTQAQSTDDLRRFMLQHAAMAEVEYRRLFGGLSALSVADAEAVKACVRRSSSSCLAGLSATVPANILDDARLLMRNVLATSFVLGLCPANGPVRCPAGTEVSSALEFLAHPPGAPTTGTGSGHGVVVTNGNAGGTPTGSATGTATGSATGTATGDANGTGSGSGSGTATGTAAGSQTRNSLDRLLADSPPPESPGACNLGDSPTRPCNPGVGAPVPPGVQGAVAVASATLNPDGVQTEAARFLVRAQGMAYFSILARTPGMDAAEFRRQADALTAACPDSAQARSLRETLGSMGASMQGEFARASTPTTAGADAPVAVSREAYATASVAAALELARLDHDTRQLMGDFDGPPSNLAQRWPAIAPCHTAAQIFDAYSDAWSITHSQAECSTRQLGIESDLSAPRTYAEQRSLYIRSNQSGVPGAWTDADRWLLRVPVPALDPSGQVLRNADGTPVLRAVPLVMDPSTARERCRIKSLLLEGSAARRAELLARFPELGEQRDGRFAYLGVADRAGHDLSGARAQVTTSLERGQANPRLAELLDGVQRICADPTKAGDRVLRDDGLLANFLACPRQVPAGSSEFAQAEARKCRELRLQGPILCQARDRARAISAGDVYQLAAQTASTGLDRTRHRRLLHRRELRGERPGFDRRERRLGHAPRGGRRGGTRAAEPRGRGGLRARTRESVDARVHRAFGRAGRRRRTDRARRRRERERQILGGPGQRRDPARHSGSRAGRDRQARSRHRPGDAHRSRDLRRRFRAFVGRQ
jgi:hypothetical protein